MRASLSACKDLDSVFEPIDEGFDHIALDGLDDADFNRFYQAANNAFRQYVAARDDYASSQYYPGIVERWGELMTLLEADSRRQA
jgi:hypothetical protein